MLVVVDTTEVDDTELMVMLSPIVCVSVISVILLSVVASVMFGKKSGKVAVAVDSLEEFNSVASVVINLTVDFTRSVVEFVIWLVL